MDNNHDDWIDYLFLYLNMWKVAQGIVVLGERTACTLQDGDSFNFMYSTFYSVGEEIL